VTVDHRVTAGVTEAVTDTVTPNWRSGMEPRTRGHRLQAAQTDGFIQKNGKAITVKHDVTAGVTNAVTESVTATPAVSADHWVTAGVT
jgi:hypothetical protein